VGLVELPPVSAVIEKWGVAWKSAD
jgi:hypothetical protein